MRRTLVLSLFLTIALAPLPSMAQAKRAMTIDDLITAIRVADPQLSPDGKRVIFTRTTTVGDSGRRNSDIWVVPSDASAPARQFIVGDKSASHPTASESCSCQLVTAFLRCISPMPKGTVRNRSPDCRAAFSHRWSYRRTARRLRTSPMCIRSAKTKSAIAGCAKLRKKIQ